MTSWSTDGLAVSTSPLWGRRQGVWSNKKGGEKAMLRIEKPEEDHSVGDERETRRTRRLASSSSGHRRSNQRGYRGI